jgi:cephalosporin-C deacetylase-like acetyl esterase
LPGDKRGQAMFYASHGLVLFVPHRRGEGQSGDVAEYIVAHASDHARVVDELATTQTDDVMSAVEYVRSLPYVDRTRVGDAPASRMA